jgi:hypothetical protein
VRRTTAHRRSLATAAALTALMILSFAGTAAAGGKGGGGGSCRKSCPAASTTSTTAPATTTTTQTPTTTTTAPAPPPSDPPPAGDPADTVIADPTATGTLDPLLRTRLIQWGAATGVLYIDSATFNPSVWFRDGTTQATSIVDLPSQSRDGWVYAAAGMTSATDLWISGGNGPILLRHYILTGSPLPTAATLVETRTFGNADSRPGDLIPLASGGVALAWHQQGATGPQGQNVAHRSPAGVWTELPSLTFMPTHYADQVLVQHPSDGSVWLFNNPDMWGAVGAAHLIESTSGLAVDWTDGSFLSEQQHGLNGPDPENPDLAVAADPATGTVALAYQSRDRRYVGPSSNLRVVSRIAVARIPATGAPSFLTAPVWAERVADVGLVVEGAGTAVTYREVDDATGTLQGIHVIRHAAGAWQAPEPVANGSLTTVAYAAGRTELAGLADDWQVHVVAP